MYAFVQEKITIDFWQQFFFRRHSIVLSDWLNETVPFTRQQTTTPWTGITRHILDRRVEIIQLKSIRLWGQNTQISSCCLTLATECRPQRLVTDSFLKSSAPAQFQFLTFFKMTLNLLMIFYIPAPNKATTKTMLYFIIFATPLLRSLIKKLNRMSFGGIPPSNVHTIFCTLCFLILAAHTQSLSQRGLISVCTHQTTVSSQKDTSELLRTLQNL